MKKFLSTSYWFFIFLIVLASCSSTRYTERNYTYPKRRVPIALPVKPPVKTTPPWKASRELIVIDAGHGGEDMGTRSLSGPKYEEKSLTLSTSLLLRTYLKQMGFEVKMTRTHDCFIALDQRTCFANDNNPQLFVSLHYNSAPSKEADGIEIYYFKSTEDKKRSEQSRVLAESVLKRMITNTSARSRGVKHGNFAVIRETKMPAILIEGGFMTNSEEMDKIKDPSYLKQIAWGIAQGIDDFMKSPS